MQQLSRKSEGDGLRRKWIEYRRHLAEKLLSTRFNLYQASVVLSMAVIGFILISLLTE